MAATVVACGSGDDQPTPPNSSYDFGGNARLKASVVVLSQAVAERAQVTSTRVVLPRQGNEALLASLKPGAPLVAGRRKNVFASNNALGILRKVVSVRPDDTTIEIETAPATLADVFEGDFSVTTPPEQLVPINPAGLDVVAYFFGDDPGIDLADCDATGLCKPKPDDGSGTAAMMLSGKQPRRSPLYDAIPARYASPLPGKAAPQPGTKSLSANDLTSAGPAAVGAALSDVVAVRTRVRAVAEKGLDAFSRADTEKLFRIMARSFADAGDTKNAEAATTLASYVADPANYAKFKSILRAPVGPGLAAKGIIGDIVDGIVSVVTSVVDAITSLLDVDVTLRLPTLGVKKDNPVKATFLAGAQVKKLGKAEYAISTKGNVSAYAYVSTQAHFDGHIGFPTRATFWLGGEFGAGAAIDAELKASLQSMSGEEKLAERLLQNPTKSATPWSKHLKTLGPYAGPSIGPVPTAFSVELSLECSWSLYGQITYKAQTDLTAAAKIGASVSTSSGWSTIANGEWNRTSSQEILLGGGAEVECGLVSEVSWLVADAVGPYVSLTPGVKAEATYAESCTEATGTKPDAAVELKVDATLSSEVGAKLDFAGFELGSLKAATLFEEEWELYSREYAWPGAGLGYCSISCDDHRTNGTETDVDCGGDCSAAGRACKQGQSCKTAADCSKGGSCVASKCVDPAHCSSGTTDGDETDVDCGGGCAGCPLGKACTVATDCKSLNCQGGACAAPTCSDGQPNGDETDVDCGSAACIAEKRLCKLGQRCTDASQCVFGTTCVGGKCAPPATCSNGMRDPGEASWDCGGPCPACEDGLWCTKNADCASGVCDGTCQAPSCKDGVMNGGETDLDCGGTCSASGARCAHGKACKVDGDCVVNDRCLGGVCVPPAHCFDGAKNSGESGVDCGGSECFACGDGKTCGAVTDCLSKSCLGGVCRTASCSDGVRADDETDVDCGGVCRAQYKFCSPGQKCVTNADCGGLNGSWYGPVCDGGVCRAPAECSNFKVDSKTYESDVDCGGSCPLCGLNKFCTYEGDCQSGVCQTLGDDCLGSNCGLRRCRASSCDDRARNGDESDVDCGGSCAAAGRRCAAGKRCNATSDCLPSHTCVTGLCVAPASCSDGTANGAESDVDCGGGVCAKCAVGKTCRGPDDCASGSCDAGKCGSASCTNGIKDGDEIDVDCGPSCGKTCKEGQKCFGSLCGSGLTCSGYTAGVCFDRTCDDFARGGTETDVDCGGDRCKPCGEGKACALGRDCTSGVCTGGKCAGPSCGDGVRNGNESDVDCGGSCPACATWKRCGKGGDCASGSCIAGACQSSSCGDGLKNGGETDIDCGGVCAAGGKTCAAGRSCGIDGDCASAFCKASVCAVSSCTDGLKHGTETDIDCGGTCPTKCAIGKGCTASTDCATGVCSGGKCSAPSCSDGVKNGTETATDCGGGCPGCADLSACLVNADCTSRYCSSGSCAVATCTDGVSDGKETGIDCGGGTCPACGTGNPCSVGSDCVGGVCTAGTCAAPSCTDAVKNGSETDIDCGGSCSSIGRKCAAGKKCSVNGDCVSGACTGGLCAAATSCTDSIQNGTETDVDCGGGCPVCLYNQKCAIGADCEFGVCTGGRCAAPSCTDGVKNGSESDVDCGAGTCALCATGKRCNFTTNCVSGNTCVGGFCVAPATCADSLKNGAETDVDCGGGACGACAAGKTCSVVADCQSRVCSGSVCQAPTCTDVVKNGTETDVDCGGTCASSGYRCGVGKTCNATSDCAAPNTCVLSVCTAPATCTDGIKNQDESDIDCGGTICPKCGPGKTCGAGSHCTSLVCSGGYCASPSCTDVVKNGTETDVDCGGSCPKCANGRICGTGVDCQSAVCSGGACTVPTCTDAVKNQTETGVDCGGACVAAGKRCANGVSCGINDDCQSLYCAGGTCAAGACSDSVKNGSETDVDCGGSCPKCATGKACSVAGDCLSAKCSALVCAAPTCSPTCGTGAACGVNGDCASGTCTAGACAAPTCGPTCADGAGCGSHADCASGACKAGVCVAHFAAATFLTSDGANWLAGAGDLDGDGKIDVGSVTDPGNVNLFYGTGPATFASYVLGPNAGQWAIYPGFRFIDLNGDAKLDLVGVDSFDRMRVNLGNGDRTFGAVITSNIGIGAPSGMALADLNKDGKLDSLALASLTPDLAVMLGNGLGGFGASTKYTVNNGGGDTGGIGTGDLDGDGNLDVVAGSSSGVLSVLRGSATGALGAPTSYSSGTTANTSVVLADVSGDGKLDVLVGGNSPGITMLRGNGDGTLQPATTLLTSRCWWVAVDDLNGDGVRDVVCGGDAGVIVLIGSGSGAFKAARTYTTGPYNQHGVLVDLDGDGDLDLVIASSNFTAPTKVWILRSQRL
ncbi:MAG: VCBS repeat-containing protein [Deltaproteobacteria bacterium]|nr:VCBS repeat-containing protein [Deltaproteobacteria bacterium]